MHKLKIILSGFLLLSSNVKAEETNLSSPFQFSIFPPLSVNGIKASEYTNGASINLLYGVSKNERNFVFSGFSNVVKNDARGVQFAGISNHIGNSGKGLAFAGITNTTNNSYNGVQFAGLTNISGKNSSGLMFGGLINITNDKFRGVQFAGLTNVAKDINGLQFAGLINIAKKVEGVQFAGLVNIAEESDCPIGVINIIKKGEMGIALTYDILGSSVVSFRSGGKYTYGILGFGYNHKYNGDDNMVAEGGYGAHIPINKYFRINNEIKVSNIGIASSENTSLNAGYLLLPSFTFKKHYNVFAGASINYFMSKSENSINILPEKSIWKSYENGNFKSLYIGYQVGLQYIF